MFPVRSVWRAAGSSSWLPSAREIETRCSKSNRGLGASGKQTELSLERTRLINICKYLLGRVKKTKTGFPQCVPVTEQGEMGTNLNTGNFI